MFDPWQALIFTGTLLFSVALIPQLVRTVQLGKADDMSASFIALILVASACNLVYFLHLREWIAASGFVVNLLVWGIVFRYRLFPRAKTS